MWRELTRRLTCLIKGHDYTVWREEPVQPGEMVWAECPRCGRDGLVIVMSGRVWRWEGKA